MTATNLPNTLLKLGLALAKHHIKNVIGDEALEVVATTLTDVGGEKVQAKVDSIFASKEGKKELLKAAKAADKNFQEKCKDNDLRSLFTMGAWPSPPRMTRHSKCGRWRRDGSSRHCQPEWNYAAAL